VRAENAAGSHPAAPGAADAKLESEPQPPEGVDLQKLRWTDGDAVVPLPGGGTAQLTLDEALQKTSAKLLQSARALGGAVVVVHAPTGRVLVWTDRTRNGPGNGELLRDATLPSGSLFKLVTTAALLEKGRVNLSQRVCSSGGMHGIERRHLEPPKEGAVCSTFGQALGHSRNAVFAQLVTARLMRSDLVEMSERFGFGSALPFAVPVRLGTCSVPYGDLEVARTATGFQRTTLSPLGALALAYTVATGGERTQFEIIASAGDYTAPPTRRSLGRVLDARVAARLRRMMEVTVSSGTSLEAFTDPSGTPYLRNMRVAGKTGTLQPKKGGPTTSWFVGFAPSTSPEILVSVVLRNGAVWHRKANEVARDVLRAYFAARGRPGITPPDENSAGGEPESVARTASRTDVSKRR
jgi:cell division protein FtsI/penicillin-binding protein 2